MTWRTIFYSVTVLFAAAIVATTASSDVGDTETQATAIVATAVPTNMPVTERSSRVVLAVVGAGAILVTFRRALANLV
jgi:hypothetical protein